VGKDFFCDFTFNEVRDTNFIVQAIPKSRSLIFWIIQCKYRLHFFHC